jgi:rod shape-determining protein MreC
VVGRISAVSPLTSQVDLLTRKGSGIGAVVGQIGETGALGVVTGTSESDLLEMKYVSGNIEVSVGQQIFTTGQDSIYPAGLKVGEIVSVVSGSATTPHKILVRPAAKISAMKEVGILLYEPPEQLEYEKKLPNAVKPKQ